MVKKVVNLSLYEDTKKAEVFNFLNFLIVTNHETFAHFLTDF